MQGNPRAPPQTNAQKLYFEGANLLASRAALMQAVISLILTPLFPRLMRFLGDCRLYGLCEVLHGVVYCATPFVVWSKYLAVFDLGLQGIPWAAFLVIPYTIFGREAKGANKGGEALCMSLMNLALCFPEILASAVMRPVVVLAQGSSIAPLVLAGVVSLGAAAMLFTAK
eukprot:gnl/MRDRNA2_/MRDRNA2_141881_c0_seq1.p1 gnl/MRDRNA2_/MRDRNA2_141881_c0~~gnl/MRDRNA2_/MRDRNA2_141881_c0_seq1.p1  ORF type:complete len:170 (+),score=15.44 gnl/MRDRNA2_/MRDRNA2_141881_c0_seq1:2-511(+)